MTHDLRHRIKGLRQLGLHTPDTNDPFFERLKEGMLSRLRGYLPQWEVVSIEMEDLSDEIWAHVMKKQSYLKDAVVVSTCSELAVARHGVVFEINRIVDFDGTMIGIGPRPGHSDLGEQIQVIKNTAGKNPVVLIEDGSFSGSTLKFVSESLKSEGVEIEAIVIGICFFKAKKVLEKFYSGEITVAAADLGNPIEWMPDHDFIPFSPNCGRIVGSEVRGQVYPWYTHEGLSFSFPYILPFGDPVKWASIPKEHALDFSLFCMQQTLELFRKIEQMNGNKRLTIRDLSDATPRVSIPITRGNGSLPNSQGFIVDFLSDVCHELS